MSVQFAGWLTAVVDNDLDEAIKLTDRSLNFDNTISETYYHLAKFYAIKGDFKSSRKYLLNAIFIHDKRYCIKAIKDPDFDKVRDELNQLLYSLKDQAKNIFYDKFMQINRNYITLENSMKKKIDNLWKMIDKIVEDDTYFSYLKGQDIARELLLDRTDTYDRAIWHMKHGHCYFTGDKKVHIVRWGGHEKRLSKRRKTRSKEDEKTI